jgi:hypothetical protein
MVNAAAPKKLDRFALKPAAVGVLPPPSSFNLQGVDDEALLVRFVVLVSRPRCGGLLRALCMLVQVQTPACPKFGSRAVHLHCWILCTKKTVCTAQC